MTGHMDKAKCRIVAQGFTQRYGVDFTETYATTPKLSTMRLFMKKALQLKMRRCEWDIKAAYLHSLLEESIFMKPPYGMEKLDARRWKWASQRMRLSYAANSDSFLTIGTSWVRVRVTGSDGSPRINLIQMDLMTDGLWGPFGNCLTFPGCPLPGCHGGCLFTTVFLVYVVLRHVVNKLVTRLNSKVYLLQITAASEACGA